MSATIPDTHKDLLARPIVVTFVTMMPDGQPQATPVWFSYDGKTVKINSARGRQKDKNLQQNPRVTVLAIDPEDPYRWIEVRGVVDEITEEGAVDHINELSMRYMNQIYYGGRWPVERQNQETRVIYKIRLTRVTHSG